MAARISGNHPLRLNTVQTTTSFLPLAGCRTVSCTAVPAKRIAHEIGPDDLQKPHQRGDVVGQGFITYGAIDVGGAAIGLEIDSNDLMGRCKSGCDRRPHLSRPHSAVQ
jgi:hypothetical protein